MTKALILPVGKCAIAPDHGAKALYLTGKSLERKKDWAGAAKAYEPYLPVSRAFNGRRWLLAGIGYQESNNADKAIALWEKQVARIPMAILLERFGAWRGQHLRKATPKRPSNGQAKPIRHRPDRYFYQRFVQYWKARWKIHPS